MKCMYKVNSVFLRFLSFSDGFISYLPKYDGLQSENLTLLFSRFHSGLNDPSTIIGTRFMIKNVETTIK